MGMFATCHHQNGYGFSESATLTSRHKLVKSSPRGASARTIRCHRHELIYEAVVKRAFDQVMYERMNE